MNRVKLRDWLRLEEQNKLVGEAVEERNPLKLSQAIQEYVTICGGENLDTVFWLDAAIMYSQAIILNKPRMDFPIMGAKSAKEKLGWEYDGRMWYFWYHLFAKNYGWTENMIAHLDIDDALGLLQEIELDKQLDREWEYGLSEVAFQYDKSSKQSKFVPLTRPTWMQGKIEPPKKIRISKSLMPVGNVIMNEEVADDKPAQTKFEPI